MVSMSEAPLETEIAGSESPPGGALGMGARLRRAREAAGISVEDAAAQLRLSPRQVLALESEQFELLPGRTFVRGFVKNYARLLELDPEPLLVLAGQNLDSPVLQPIAAGMGVIPAEHSGPAAWQKWAILAMLVTAIIAGAGYEWWQRQASRGPIPPAGGTSAGSSLANSPEVKELPTPPSSGCLPQIETQVKPAPELSQPASSPIKADIAPKGAAIEALVNKAAPAAAKPVPAAPPPSAKVAVGAGKIGLQFSETSWVEVRDRGGQILLSQHYGAGQHALVSGEPPFEIIVGNAAATRISYDGKTVDLSPHARQNVARITLP